MWKKSDYEFQTDVLCDYVLHLLFDMHRSSVYLQATILFKFNSKESKDPDLLISCELEKRASSMYLITVLYGLF